MSVTASELSRPWYERQPERLAWEREQFAARGLSLRGERMGLTDGRLSSQLVMETALTYRGESQRVEVAFPFDYPDAAPTVYGRPELLPRHQQPIAGNFCWAEDPDRDWSSSMDAAGVVAESIRWLFDDMEAGPDRVETGEADMPEPLTGLVAAGPGAVVVPDPFFEYELPAAQGAMTLLGDSGRYYLTDASSLGRPDPALGERYFKGQPEHSGYWLAVDPAPAATELSGAALLDLVDRQAPRAFERLQRKLKRVNGRSVADGWVGITFLEEGPRRGQVRRNWLFVRVEQHRGGQRRRGSFIRAQALTRAERQRRTPELVGLDRASVLVIGAGSLGSPLALELAKAGVGRLDLVDPDGFDVNNSVRHVLSPRLANSNKALAVAVYAREINPFIDVRSHTDLVIGGGAQDAAAAAELVESADAVVDTTGSASVTRILQRHCEAAAKPLLVAGLTAGSYGGEVAVFRPGGACFECLVLAQRDGTVPQPLSAPATSLVTPVGCSHPAFAGTGFDATELAAIAARAVVQTTDASTYPPLGFDWAVVNFRGAPRWTEGPLGRHPDCPRCST